VRDALGGRERRSRLHRSLPPALGLADSRARHEAYSGTILAVAALAASATGAYATYAQGQNASAAARYNAQVAEIEAQQNRDAAKVQAENQAEAARRVIAGNRARIGGSGIQMNEGSPLLSLMDNAYQESLEQSRIKYAGEIGATGRESTATLLRFQGGNAATAGAIGAGVNLLSGVANTAGRYYGRSSRLTALGSDAI
jgi:hypothetical protein